MRTTLKHTLAACIALVALMLSGTACTQDDPLGNGNPPGTQLLQLGKVTIAGAETATRSTGAADATTGFTGIRKHAFVKDDELKLTLTPPAGTGGSGGGTSVEVTAKLSTDGTTNRWTLPTKTYFTPGTTIDARYTPATGKQPGGIRYSDDLVTAQPVEPLADGTPLALTLTHANAMVEVTPPASLITAGTAYSDLSISVTPAAPAGGGAGTTPETLVTAQEGSGNDPRHRTIAPAGATLKSISLKVNGMTYTAPIAPEVVVAANKRYPIALTIVGDELVATVAAGTNWDDGGDFEGIPTGYTYYIRTAEDLEKFRDDVNKEPDANATKSWTVLQMADIDLGHIDNWVPIGKTNGYFAGTYNGNGHTISNLKMSLKNITDGSINRMALFEGVKEGAVLTGIHLRNCQIKAENVSITRAAALTGYANGCTITLCSATGTISATGATNSYVGGLIAYASSGAYITRCSANVDVTMASDAYCGGFLASSENEVYLVGCIASGKVTQAGAGGTFSGFSNSPGGQFYYCISASDMTDAGATKTAFGAASKIYACLATGTGYTNFYTSSSTPQSNVCVGTLTNVQTGVTVETPANAYAALTAGNLSTSVKIPTVHYSKEDGYTTNVVTQTWYAEKIWKENTGALPTLDMGYEGDPEPITTGNKVYRVNGYWVTAPESETASPGYTWEEAKSLCAAGTNKGWRMPTMKDFEVIAGWGTSNQWNYSSNINQIALGAGTTVFSNAFPLSPAKLYWAIEEHSVENTKAWGLNVGSATTARYSFGLKAEKFLIRCIQAP